MSAVTIQQMADRIADLMEERLNVRGKGLTEKVRKAGRLLPRRVRLAAERLSDAAERSKNPKLLLQIDEAVVAASYDVCSKHLVKIDAGSRRMGMVLGMAGSVAGLLLAVMVLAAVVLYWRGYL